MLKAIANERPVPVSQGGTGQATQTAAFDALAPTTTKGDVIVHNGTDNVRQAAGTAGQILGVNSNNSTGLGWQDIPANAGIVSGRYLVCPSVTALNAFSHATANVYAVPVYVAVRQTFTGISFGIDTSSTNLNVKVGVYTNSSGVPGTIIAGTTATGGAYTGGAFSPAISYGTAFSDTPYIVIAKAGPGDLATTGVGTTSVTSSGFTGVQRVTSSGGASTSGFYWLAIGPT